MQGVVSVMINLIIPLRKENGIRKKHAPNYIPSFLVDPRSALSSRRGAIVLMHAYSGAVSINLHLRVQFAVLYAIAESKAFIWSFWVYRLNFPDLPIPSWCTILGDSPSYFGMLM